jgi:hypothetical protein
MNKGLDLAGLVKELLGIINSVIPILAGIAIIVFFWGLIGYIRESGDAHGHGHKKEVIWWGLIAIFVIFCVWGILNFFQIALFPAGNTTVNNTSNYYGAPIGGRGINGIGNPGITQ